MQGQTAHPQVVVVVVAVVVSLEGRMAGAMIVPPTQKATSWFRRGAAWPVPAWHEPNAGDGERRPYTVPPRTSSTASRCARSARASKQTNRTRAMGESSQHSWTVPTATLAAASGG